MHMTRRRFTDAPSRAFLDLDALRLSGIEAILAAPERYSHDVQRAVAIVLSAARDGSTSSSVTGVGTGTASVTGRFQNVLDLLTVAIDDVDGEVDSIHLVDIPHFVPENWVQSLNIKVADDELLSPPWLDEL